jgi:hypothetical protein
MERGDGANMQYGYLLSTVKQVEMSPFWEIAGVAED